ncbi:MAG TPA: Spy/CpxP family protein refolding chaperone [Candidatus Baltobacteraceae bacterium]|nr:Spy/CpxP family protein refolding chaperone [Candidatus Baltobacteraceae bacterium]
MFIRTAIAVVVAATVIQTGAAFAQTAPQSAAPPAATQRHHHSALFRGLNLSSDQKAQIKSIRQKYRAQNQSITDRNQRRESMRAQRQEIMAVLNPDQRAKFQQRLQTMRQHHAQGQQQAPNAPAPQSR